MNGFAKLFEKQGCKRAEWHYSGAARFGLSGHVYFPVGDKVCCYEVYRGVTVATVVDAYHTDKRNSGTVTYVLKVVLPKGHPDAQDENGRTQRTKYILASDAELSRHNPNYGSALTKPWLGYVTTTK